MSLAKKSFMQKAAMAAPFVLAFGLAANNAQAEVAYGCRTPDKVPALQQQVLKEEGMVPVAGRFVARSETEYAQEAIMLNPNTKNGLRWIKHADGTVCIFTKYENAEIFDHKAFDNRAVLSVAGKDPTHVPINVVLASSSLDKGQNPMFRATAITPTNASKNDPVNYPTRYVEYMLGNPVSQKGSVLAAAFDGRSIAPYTKYIPAAGEAPGVKFGAIFTTVGEDLIKGARVAGIGSSTTVALNKN
jgi:hypothetical protein